MLIKYIDYFRKIFNSDEDLYGELLGILEDIVDKNKSEDISAFLFSVEKNKVTKGNDVFSFNQRLSQDSCRKIIFIYFYVTMIYYVATLMKHKGLEMPRCIMFSGTGSKVLKIVGGMRELNNLTQIVIERIYGKEYNSYDGFSVVIEENEPKQITCRGALLQVKSETGCQAINEINRRMDDFKAPLKSNYSMISKPVLQYGDIKDHKVIEEIIEQVRQYNEFFISLCDDIRVSDRFLVDGEAWNTFKENVNRDLEHHFIQGWNFVNKDQAMLNDSDPVPDALFFYPIIGSIRNNLIDNIKEKDL